jgi:hypothetical protein
MNRACSTNGGKRGMHIEYMVGKPEGKRPLGKPRCRTVDNVKVDRRDIEVGWYGLDRSGLVNSGEIF